MTRLRLAVPSKGRLKEQADAYFEDADLRLSSLGGDRGYSARMDGLPGVDVLLLSTSEIASALIAGDVHVGVAGEDLLRETAPDLSAAVHLLSPLGFGFARLVVAVPQSWIDVASMSDLDDVGARFEARTGRRLRVATKYARLTRRFFAERGVTHYRIVESGGATEGTPASGAAELIVDITTTGATLAGNGLKILQDGLILSSEAQLAASLKADWSAESNAQLRALMSILSARSEGRASRSLLFAPGFSAGKLAGGLASRLDVLRPGEAVCRREDAHELARAIVDAGGGPVRTQDADFVFRAENASFLAFEAALLRLRSSSR
jgi:ATP phosphoribosyltransferase